MQNSNSENNKRIAKNTMFLYFRSILTLGVGLYTSREILAQLGVSDFGVYNVVGGVIVLFSFIQNAMNSATSRFFTFDLGKGDFQALKKTFSLSVAIHIFTAILILILGETIGLWFLNTQLVIPEERMGAANFVYQFTVFTACVGILQVPYMVAITAHERMKVFAYAGIADAVFKLTVAISLGFAPIDKLEFYSVLLFGVYIVMVVFYRVYCHRNFKETHFKWFWDKKMFLERMGFGGFELLGGDFRGFVDTGRDFFDKPFLWRSA
jgi:O-antigen/teichoic acid export membrane protein